MATLRSEKQRLKKILQQADWQNELGGIAEGGMNAAGPLFSFLLLEPEFMHRAAAALGETVAKVHERDPEAGKNLIRRFMWQMNEDSGNIGWGIPCAFAETLVRNSELAKMYASILLSYIMELGFADNYCDHAQLRRDCFWAAGRLAQVFPELVEKARPWLVKGLADEDSICQGMAAWAIGQLGANLMDAPALQKLANAGNTETCAIFDNGKMNEYTVTELAKMALDKGKKR